MIAASVTSPPTVPINAGRQPRMTPAASTIVIASTASTDEPRNAAAICGVAWTQLTGCSLWMMFVMRSAARPLTGVQARTHLLAVHPGERRGHVRRCRGQPGAAGGDPCNDDENDEAFECLHARCSGMGTQAELSRAPVASQLHAPLPSISYATGDGMHRPQASISAVTHDRCDATPQ